MIRAISKITNQDWHTTYLGVALKGYELNDMPSSNATWGAYLKSLGYSRHVIPNTCPDCYSVHDFCIEHPIGRYLLATGSHVITVIDGDYYDTWDSGNEVPIFYWIKEK